MDQHINMNNNICWADAIRKKLIIQIEIHVYHTEKKCIMTETKTTYVPLVM